VLGRTGTISVCEIDWSQAPAWVQAIGSVLAIIIAVVISERTSKQARDLVVSERKRQADITASSLAMKLHLLNVEIEKRISFVSHLANSERQGNPGLPRPADLSSIFLLGNIDYVIAARQSNTIFDRETGILVNTVIDALEQYNPSVSSSIAMVEYFGFIPLCEDAVSKLRNLHDLSLQAEQRLDQAHGLT
jgi:hypothetical protein